MPGAKIPQDWDGEEWECWVVQWPKSRDWYAILQGFLSTAKMGRYWDGATGSITGVQAVGVEIANRNLILEECLMTCNEDSLAMLGEIRDAILAIANKECCPSAGTGQGSRGAGGTQQPPVPYDQTETPETPPEGFEDMTSYQSHKCDAAQDIITALGADLQSLSAVEYSLSSPTGLAGIVILLLLDPIPYDELIALLGYLIFTGYNYALLSTMSALIKDNENDLRCTLFNSGSVDIAESEFFAALETLANDNFTSPTDAEWVMGAVDYFMVNDVFNPLFKNVPTVSQGADCSECSDTALSFIGIPWTCQATITDGSLEANAYHLESCYGDVPPFGITTNSAWINTNIETNIKVTFGASLVSGSLVDLVVGYSIDGVNQTPINYDTYGDMPKVWEVTHIVLIRAGDPGGYTTSFELDVLIEEP